MTHSYYLIYKPYGVLSQFTAPVPGKRTLRELYDFPKDVYPVGRLDEDSEGLLLLTNDPRWNQKLLGKGVAKEYWVQVEGVPTDEDLEPLRQGVEIRVRKKPHHTLTAQVNILNPEPKLPPRNPPIRFRKNKPTSWLSLTLREGKNRQVRKMTAKVGFPTLRLVRYRLGTWNISGMAVGEVKKLSLT